MFFCYCEKIDVITAEIMHSCIHNILTSYATTSHQNSKNFFRHQFVLFLFICFCHNI